MVSEVSWCMTLIWERLSRRIAIVCKVEFEDQQIPISRYLIPLLPCAAMRPCGHAHGLIQYMENQSSSNYVADGSTRSIYLECM